MRPPGNPIRGARTDHKGTETGEELHDEPHAQVEDGGQADKAAKEEDGDESDHVRGGIKHEIRTHDGGDGAAGTQGGDIQSGGEEELQQGGTETPQQVEEQIAG